MRFTVRVNLPRTRQAARAKPSACAPQHPQQGDCRQRRRLDGRRRGTDATTVTAGPTSPLQGPSNVGGGCVIASLAYGSYLDPHVQSLRAFRYGWLLAGAPGRMFVAWNDRVSPPIADVISRHRALRWMTIAALTPLVVTVEPPRPRDRAPGAARGAAFSDDAVFCDAPQSKGHKLQRLFTPRTQACLGRTMRRVYIQISSLFFALMGLIVKGLSQRLPSDEVAMVRTVLPALLLTPAIVSDFRRQGAHLRGEIPFLLLRGFFGSAALLCYFRAISLIEFSNAALLCYTSPIFTALLASIFLGERLTRRMMISLPVVLAGIVLVTRPTLLFGGAVPAHFVEGCTYGLLSGLAAGGSYTSVRRLAGRCRTTTIVGVFGWVGTLICAPLLAHHYVSPTPREWGAMVLVALLATGGQYFMTLGYRSDSAARASTMSLSVVPLAALLGWLVLHETLGLMDAAGMAISLCGLVIAAGASPAPDPAEAPEAPP